MELSDFDYDFPKELIAKRPLPKRDDSRLLVIDRKASRIQHRTFVELPDYLGKTDVVVLNDTKVVPAAIKARLNNHTEVGMLVLERTDSHTVRCLAKPAKKFKKGVKIFFPDGTSATVIEDGSPKTLEFARPIDEMLKAHGSMPLPPYIKREPDKQDFDAYQTVYARNEGAVAAPTAGLHFTADVLKAISKKNAKTAFVTLHVGWGTFRPVRCDDIAGHRMHKERFSVPQETMDAVMDARRKGGRILAVGTTTCRVLETIARRGHPAAEDNCLVAGCPRDCEGETDLFIYPPYQFRLTDMLLTNFHLPRTTLLMLVSAFCGYDLMMKAYKEAIEKRYRLFSYGDAMLIV